ncbi:MAG: phosphoglycerate mutase, partial [Lachnospiraceae bacterium]|nr:phosphoglycerate mutase [Lachnospiraceae bacterium]
PRHWVGNAPAAGPALAADAFDFAYVHLEAPDEMGHQGSVKKKVQAIEYLDERVTALIADGLDKAGEAYRMLILPDHPTPIRVRTHTADAVPYLLYDSERPEAHTWNYNEREAAQSGNNVAHGYEMIEKLFSIG